MSLLEVVVGREAVCITSDLLCVVAALSRILLFFSVFVVKIFIALRDDCYVSYTVLLGGLFFHYRL